ncbi:MAG: hypothetical protein K940chlam7_00906, partial [Chlamydiae bacterium]|nr:hypothetical protein [Chlamydiota bacterium]
MADRIIDEVHLRRVECEESRKEMNALANTRIFLWQFKMRLLDNMRGGFLIKESDFDKEIVNTRNALKKAVSESSSLSIQRAARLTLVMSYHYLPPNKEEDFIDILECLWVAQLTSDAKEDCDPSIENQAKQLFFQLLPQIKDRLTPKILNQFFSNKLKEFYGIRIDEEVEVQWHDQFPNYFCQIGGDTFHINMFTWRATNNGIPLGDLSSLYENEDYKFLFGDKRFPPCVTKVVGPYFQYEIHDSSNNLIRFVLRKDSASLIRVEKEFDGKNYVYVPWRDLSEGMDWMPLPKHPNECNYVLWFNKEDSSELLVVDRQTEEVVCKIQHGSDVIYKGKTYDSVDVKTIEKNEVLQHFEHPSNILALKKKGTEDFLLEFSRYRCPVGSVVQFRTKTIKKGGKGKKESKETRLVWSRDPQYFIAENQQVNGLSGFDHCLVLENKNGRRKVLIPLQTHLSQKDFSLKTPPFIFECEVIDLSSENTLSPKTPRQYAVAAYLSLMQHEYSRALRYLKGAYHLQRYSPEDLKYLGWTIHSEKENHDNDPNAIAIRSYALWLGQDNLFRNPKEGVSKGDESSMLILPDHYKKGAFWEKYWEGSERSQSGNTIFDVVTATYSQYLNIRKNVDAGLRIDVSRKGRRRAIIKPYEEIRWLQQCLENSPSQQIMARLKYIAGLQTTFVDIRAATPTIVSPSARFDEECLKAISWGVEAGKATSQYGYEQLTFSEILERRIFPRTRPGKKFQDWFWDLYTIAKTGNPKEKKSLMYLLGDMRFENNPNNQALRAILEAIVTNHRMSSRIINKVDAFMENPSAGKSYSISKEIDSLVQEYLQDTKSTRIGTDSFEYLEESSKVIAYRPDLERFPETVPSEDDRLTWVVSGESDWKGKLKISYKKAPPKKTEPQPLMEPPRKDKYEEIRFQELKRDYEIGHTKNEELEHYVFGETNFQEVLKMFRSRNDVLIDSSHSLLQEMIFLANKAAKGDKAEEGVTQRIAEYGRKRKRVDFSDLVGVFLQQSKHGYQRLNPSLTERDIEELHNLVGNYILFCLEINRNNETMKPLEALTSKQKGSDSENKETALQELGRCLDATDMKQCLQFPAFMVFEWAMQLHVRPDQIQNILSMLGIDKTETEGLGEKSFPNLIIQKIMGGGKTLVLGTLMSLLKADGYHLSVLIPPSSLYDTNAQDMKIRLEKTFGQKTGTVIFKRGPQQFNEAYLNNLYHRFINAIKDRDAIIVTPESLQAMQNQYIEAREELRVLYEQKKTTVDPNDLEKITIKIERLEKPTRILKEILRLIAERAIFTFDEVDVVLDTRKELNFPLGNRFREHPQGIEFLAKLFAIAASDPDIIKAGLNLADNEQAKLMPEQYEKIKQLLAQKVMVEIANSDTWCERLFLDAEIGKKDVSNLLNKEHPFSSDIYQYICSPNALVPEFVQKLHQSEDPSKQLAADWHVLLHQELNEWLQESWKKSADLHYGFSQVDEKKRIAIPFSANNTPSERSEFADAWEMINRTLQLYIYKGLSESQTIGFIKKMQQKVRTEWDRAGRSIAISEMPTAKVFKRIVGRDVFSVSTIDVSHVRHVQAVLKTSKEREAFDFVLSYVADEVLSKQEFNEEQINNNGQNLAAMPKAKQGYTGTIESKDTFPYDFELHSDIGTNGRIIDVLLRRNNVVHVVKGGTVKEHLKQVFANNPNAHKFRALIDIGPMYKGVDSRQIAIDILDFMQSQEESSQVKGVLYWDDQTKMLCCIKSGEEGSPIVFPATDPDTIFSLTGLEREELFAFYPHHKITGADLALSRDAYALTTFAENTPLRDILQGVMRMRKLFDAQHVETMLEESVLPIINKKLQDHFDDSTRVSKVGGKTLSVNHLISFGELIEADRQKKDIVRSVLQQVHNQLRQHVMKLLMEAKTGKEENNLYTSARHLFVRKPVGSLFEQYGVAPQDIPTANFIIQHIDSFLRPLYNIGLREIISNKGEILTCDKPLPKEFLAVCKIIQALINDKLDKLPDTIPNRINLDWGKESTVEQLEETVAEDTLEQQNEYQLELEFSLKPASSITQATEEVWEREQIDSLFSQGFTTTKYPSKTTAHPSTWKLSDVLKGMRNLEKYATCFSDNILVTENFLATVEGQHNVFDDKQKVICQVVAIYDTQCKETNPWKLTLCSQKEAAKFMEAIYRQKEKRNDRFNVFLLEPEGTVVQQGQILLDSIDTTDLNWLRSSLVEVLFMSGNIGALNADKWQQPVQEWAQNYSQEKKELLEIVILREGESSSQEYEGSRLQTILHRMSRLSVSPDEGVVDSVEENLRMATLALNNHNIEKGLELLLKLKQKPAEERVVNEMLRLAAKAIKNTNKAKNKNKGKRILVGLLDCVRLHVKADHFSSSEALSELKDINDSEIKEATHDIILELIQKKQFQLAVDLACAQIPTLSQEFVAEERKKGKIKVLLKFTLQQLISLGEQNQKPQVKQLSASLYKALCGTCNPPRESYQQAFWEVVQEILAEKKPKTLLSGLDDFCSDYFGSYSSAVEARSIREQIREIAKVDYYNTSTESISVRVSQVIEKIEHNFLVYESFLPAVANEGKKLMETFIDEMNYITLKPSTILEVSYGLFKTQNPHAIEVANRLLEQHKRIGSSIR